MTPLAPGDGLDHYRIESLVATGGMASIFRATDLRTGAAVALKVPHPETEADPIGFERFRREAQIGRDIDHPGVVKVLPAAKSRRVYFAAEWVEGPTLRQILDSEGRLPEDKVIRIAQSLCETLDHLHRHGVAHRDLKPENIMVGPDDEVRLLDFGLAWKDGSRRLTFGKFSKIMGTADYISPEQLRGKRGGPRSDLYALGVLIYEMLTGNAPFAGVNPFTAMNRRLVADASMKGVPARFRDLLRCALERDPSLRYASAKELSEDLESPGRAIHAERHRQRPEPKRAWLLSLAVIPATILLLMLYVAQHQ